MYDGWCWYFIKHFKHLVRIFFSRVPSPWDFLSAEAFFFFSNRYLAEVLSSQIEEASEKTWCTSVVVARVEDGTECSIIPGI